jgi:hypothetical protein
MPTSASIAELAKAAALWERLARSNFSLFFQKKETSALR